MCPDGSSSHLKRMCSFVLKSLYNSILTERLNPDLRTKIGNLKIFLKKIILITFMVVKHSLFSLCNSFSSLFEDSLFCFHILQMDIKVVGNRIFSLCIDHSDPSFRWLWLYIDMHLFWNIEEWRTESKTRSQILMLPLR